LPAQCGHCGANSEYADVVFDFAAADTTPTATTSQTASTISPSLTNAPGKLGLMFFVEWVRERFPCGRKLVSKVKRLEIAQLSQRDRAAGWVS